jgi:putative SOS response-associated peptidase YedK
VLAEQFELSEVPDLEPRYNIAPTQDVAVVRQEGSTRALALLRWGLVPSWSKDPTIGARMINARAETAAEKPAFRAAFKQRRCLVLADGFYEWQSSGQGRQKQPFYIHMKDGKPFALAGLWERWQGDEGGSTLETCTILTTEPNELVRPIHNRMPVILAPADYGQWLDPAMQQAGPLQAMLQPYPAAALDAYPVSRAVNNARHDSPECVAPLA